jgi:hypothetical protein
MGVISTKLANRFKNVKLRTASGHPFALATGVKDVRQCIQQGLDPIHSAYVAAQNLMSFFAESVSEFAEFEPFCQRYIAAEDEYLPSGPPASPLTTSFFTLWALCDLRFGKDLETIGTCLLNVSGILEMVHPMVDAVRELSGSRMGIYEHCGVEGSKCRLKELLTGTEYVCHIASGYVGRAGELWYVRLCPPLVAPSDYHVAITTPYVLLSTSRADWTAYLAKSLLRLPAGRTSQGLHDLLKYGDTANDWAEFVFQSYHHHQGNAIFLTGLPDVKDSLPHAT